MSNVIPRDSGSSARPLATEKDVIEAREALRVAHPEVARTPATLEALRVAHPEVARTPAKMPEDNFVSVSIDECKCTKELPEGPPACSVFRY